MRQLGYLGKVPHRGDFVRYNVPAQLHRVWDDWLGEVLLQAGETLDGWPAGYDAAPPWQFALSPDLAGGEAHAGVLIASRDSIGRRYPFTLFATLANTTTPLETLASDPALEALERLARRAVDDVAEYERLKTALGALQESLPAARDPDAVPFRRGSSTRATEPAVFSEDAELLADRAGTTRLLDAVLRQSTGSYSVWRRRDDNAIDGRLLLSGALPQGVAAFALFGAEWTASAGGRLDGAARTDTRRPQRPSPPSAASLPAEPSATAAPPAPAAGPDAAAQPDGAATAISSATPTRIESPDATDTATTRGTESGAETASGSAVSIASDAVSEPLAGPRDVTADTPDPAHREPARARQSGSAQTPDPGAAQTPDPEAARTPDPEAAQASGPGTGRAAVPSPAEGSSPATDPSDDGLPADEPPVRVEPREVETLSIDDEDGDDPWDKP